MEFWQCTPAEIYMLVRGRGRSLRAFEALTAWHASIVIKVMTGESVSPDELLGKVKRIDVMDEGFELAEVLEGSSDG